MTAATHPPVIPAGSAQTIEAWPDKRVLEVAAGVCRERAREAFRLNRNVVTATREASQLTHLALRIDRLAEAAE